MGTVGKQSLTDAEGRCLEAFKACRRRLKGVISPTRQDIADEMAVSKVRAAYLLRRLVEKGWLTDTPKRYRQIQLA